MNLVNKFKNVLHEGEEIIDVTSASKGSYIKKRILFPLILFFVVTIIMAIIAITNPREYVDPVILHGYVLHEGYYAGGFPLWIVFLVSGIFLFILLLVAGISYRASQNYFICLTDKRIITRHGSFSTDYTYYAIEKVSGNIKINCDQSVFDQKESDCSLQINIELLPVGHGELVIFTPSLVNGYEFSKKIDSQIKANAELNSEKQIKE